MQKNIFDGWNSNLRNVESSIVNLVSSIVPWLAPVPAAYMSYQHMMKVLEFPWYVATPVAIVIEALGFATVNTILSFWSYNRKYEDDRRKSPLTLTVFTFGFYLCIVLAINVLVDATAKPVLTGHDIAIIIVRSLLTLMSIPGALILAVRTQHQEVLNDNEEQKKIRAFKKQYGDQWFEMMYGSSSGSQGSLRTREPKEPSPKALEVKEYIADFVAQRNELPKLEEIMVACAVVKSYASRLRAEWVVENNYEKVS